MEGRVLCAFCSDWLAHLAVVDVRGLHRVLHSPVLLLAVELAASPSSCGCGWCVHGWIKRVDGMEQQAGSSEGMGERDGGRAISEIDSERALDEIEPPIPIDRCNRSIEHSLWLCVL